MPLGIGKHLVDQQPRIGVIACFLGQGTGNEGAGLQTEGGQRSAKAAHWLEEAGYERVRNLRGGILAWADEVDPSTPKY